MDPSLLVASHNLATDALAADVYRALSAEGVPATLLKGPSIARWLYRPGERVYSDVDLLVPPHSVARAGGVLEGLGFRQGHEGELIGAVRHAYPWRREDGKTAIDLHTHLSGANAPEARQWEILSARTASQEVGGEELPILDESARALHIVLHVVQHGPRAGKPLADLERLLERYSQEGFWKQVADLARAMEAEQAMAEGLRRTTSGGDLAEVLGLPVVSEPEVLLRSQNTSDLAGGLALQQIMRTRGLGAKTKLAVRALFPPVHLMRARYPATERNGFLLVGAYLMWPFLVTARLLRGAPAWWRAERTSRRRRRASK